MTPPSLDVAREILAHVAAKERERGAAGDMTREAIDVVFAEIDRRSPPIVQAEIEGLRATIDLHEKHRAGLMTYIEDAVQACGDERVTGEPLAQAIRRMRDDLLKLRSHGEPVHGARR